MRRKSFAAYIGGNEKGKPKNRLMTRRSAPISEGENESKQFAVRELRMRTGEKTFDTRGGSVL